MITMTLAEALKIQQKQLDHYLTDKPYESEIRAKIASRTNTEGRDLNEQLPVGIVNQLVPRGGCIEYMIYGSIPDYD